MPHVKEITPYLPSCAWLVLLDAMSAGLSIFSSQMMILTFVDEWCSTVRSAVFPLPIIGWQTLGLFSFIASVHRPQKYMSANVSLEKKQHFCLLRIFFNRDQSEIYRIIDNIKKEMNFHVQQKRLEMKCITVMHTIGYEKAFLLYL